MRKNDQKTNERSVNKESALPTKNNLQTSVVEIKFLATSWLDDFEKQVFNGKTVNQILNPQSYE